MALTATATAKSRKEIIETLCMQGCHEVTRSPNKVNIKYSVKRKPNNPVEALLPLISSIEEYGLQSDRYVIFCSTYMQCSTILYILVDELGQRNCLYPQNSPRPVCNVYTASSTKKDKDAILQDFTKSDGVVRILVSTIAFGMGVDAPDIRHVIHWGAPHSIEMYVQESGRCRRDGINSTSCIYYTGTDFTGFSTATPEVHAYCLNTLECRRKLLMAHFDALVEKPSTNHDCCDVCAAMCKCQACASTSCNTTSSSESEHESGTSICESNKSEAIMASLQLYRSQTVSTEPLLYGVELTSGLPDCVLQNIVEHATNVNMEYLLKLGIGQEHFDHIIRIVKSYQNFCP
jgi:superfamily II DNA helicase RecQ